MSELSDALLKYMTASECRRAMEYAYGPDALINGYYMLGDKKIEIFPPSLDEIYKLEHIYKKIRDGND